MLEERLAFAAARLVDFVDADLLVPRGHGEMFRLGGEGEVRDTVFGRRVEGDVFGKVALSRR